MSAGSKIFAPTRSLGNVSNHIPLQVRYIKNRKENLIVTCVGKAFHTYGISHFGLLSVSGLHPEDITCLTSDAYHVYTASGRRVYAWRRGTELKHTYDGHKRDVHAMLPFGPHLISVDARSCVIVWDIKTEVAHLELNFKNADFEITALVHPSTYINKVLFGSRQGKLQLWNLNSGKLVYEFPGWDSPVTCLAQAPAVDVVAVGLTSGKVVLHNLKFDETLMDFSQDWGPVTTIAFRTDGHPIMATGSPNGKVVFWDLEERRVANQLAAHDGAVTGMCCPPNEPLILTSSPDNTLKLWIFDMTDGGARLLRLREGHSSPPSFVRFHNDANILSAAADSTLRIFNTTTEQFNKSLGKASYNRKVSKKRGKGDEDPLVMPPIVGFASESTREKEWDSVAALHRGIPTVTTWSYQKVKMGEHKLLPERFFKKNNNSGVEATAECLCLSKCGHFVMVGYATGHADRFNMQSGAHRDTYGSDTAHRGAVRGICSDPLNQIVVTGGTDGAVRFFRFKCGSKEPISSLVLGEPVRFFRSHGEGSLLAIALEDYALCVVDIETRQLVRRFAGHSDMITDACFSSDSRWLVSAGMDCVIRTWDVPSGQLVDQFATHSPCTSLHGSPNGEALVTSHVDQNGVFLWTNRTIYNRITLKAIDASAEAPMVVLPECRQDPCSDEPDVKPEPGAPEFKSPEQIGEELITLSGLPTSRWQNLLNIDVVRARNKPKQAPRAPKAAPFFLPTVAALDIRFDVSAPEGDSGRFLSAKNLLHLSEFGQMLDATRKTKSFAPIVQRLKSLGPSMIDFEIKSLAPEGGGSVDVMLQFLKCVEHMLKANADFELAAAYLGAFCRHHGAVIAAEEALRNYLPNVQSCHTVAWNRLQDKLLYAMCVVQNLKTM